MTRDGLPPQARDLCVAYVSGLAELLQAKLHGIYLYGATVFPESGPVRDIDCHVVLARALADSEKSAVFRLHDDLSDRFPPLGAELDAYYILYEEACGSTPPTHQLRPSMRDESWALHCAHVRAGRYVTLYGPEPVDIFPDPAWSGIAAALDHEMAFIRENLKYPDYCILNLCRIMYSFGERDVVVSKRSSGSWATTQFPDWAPAIQAAIRSYDGTARPEDEALMEKGVGCFLEFASGQIRALQAG